jgi:transposase
LIRLVPSRPGGVLGFLDETWWSRRAQPTRHTWTADAPLRLVECAVARQDPDPKAWCCYGLLRDDTGELLLRFVQGRPVRQLTEDFLAWLCPRLATEAKPALVLIWDNASWHTSPRMRGWIRAHNRPVKEQGGVRILPGRLPSTSPGLNPIEPKWAHGKKAIAEPERLLSAQELKDRVGAYYACEHYAPLEQKIEKKVA